MTVSKHHDTGGILTSGDPSARSLAARAALPLLLVRGWADNASPVSLVGTVATIVASKTVTPGFTGRFRVVVTGVARNASDETGATLTVGVGHAAGATPEDYVQAPLTVGAASAETFALVVELDQVAAPVVLPVGAPVTLHAVLTASAALTVDAHGAQIDVQELLT